MPMEEYEALRAFAFLTRTSMNEACLRAVREFLASSAREEQFEQAVEDFRKQYRVALDKLEDL